MRWPVPAAISSPVPAALLKLGPPDTGRIRELRPYFDAVPDPRSRRGRWYPLTGILLVCACAVVSGAKSIDELAGWGQRARDSLLALIGIRFTSSDGGALRGRPRSARVLGAVDGDALDRVVGACLADRHRAATEHTRTSGTSPSPRTSPPSTPAPYPAPWQPSATSPSAP
ncbi:transposase family protein [Streptomyces sp. NPDC126514]|uniref:transposase family protein n=1 Tax=Streptomyces sp. NPDC126514 TaxID=3155210 RepID=UPI0033254872